MRERRPWRFGIYTSVFILLMAAYPQIKVWLVRRSEPVTSYAFFSEDEAAYCAYVNALIDGRPRRNDPYTGRIDGPTEPQPESLFSIQFIPPYALALAAGAMGLGAPQIFFVLTCLAAFASSLMLFRLFQLLTEDEKLAAAATLFVLCLGTFAFIYGPIRLLFGLETTYTFSHLPFLRRYQPAAAYPLLFIFCTLVWQALDSKERGRARRSALLAGLLLSVLVFSYFYLWTAAAGWLACLALLWLLVRPDDFGRGLESLCLIALPVLLALVPYFYMVSQRATTTDAMQLLALTRSPDLSRSSEWLGLIVLLILSITVWRGRATPKDRRLLFALSLALAPFLIFNQQILTGRSLQPLHYELYITKYLVLIALVLTVFLLRDGGARNSRLSSRLLLIVTIIACGWGAIETVVATNRSLRPALARDEARQVFVRLDEISRSETAGGPGIQSLVLYTNISHADSSPAWAPQPVLWSPHTPAFSGVNWTENRERIYLQLYYTDFDETKSQALGLEGLSYQQRYLLRSLVGWGHADAAWSVNFRPATAAEIQAELYSYAGYRARFDSAEAGRLPLSYVVTADDEGINFSNLDRWYERDAGERLGNFTLYRVKLKR